MHEQIGGKGLIVERLQQSDHKDYITTADLVWYVNTLFSVVDAALSQAPIGTNLGILEMSIRRSFNERCLGWESSDISHPMASVLISPQAVAYRKRRLRYKDGLMQLLHEPLTAQMGFTYDDLLYSPCSFITEELYPTIRQYKEQMATERSKTQQAPATEET